MEWKSTRKGFENYLRLEKGLSKNSLLAYRNDLRKLEFYLSENEVSVSPLRITHEQLAAFVHHTARAGAQARTQARLISGIKAFFKYLIIEEYRDDDPSELLESPRLARKLPDTLSSADINTILSAIDLSKPEGTRNRAMLETLYSCGLRVSELVSLQLSDIYDSRGFVKVTGKGNKERLVPIGSEALKYIGQYRDL